MTDCTPESLSQFTTTPTMYQSTLFTPTLGHLGISLNPIDKDVSQLSKRLKKKKKKSPMGLDLSTSSPTSIFLGNIHMNNERETRVFSE